MKTTKNSRYCQSRVGIEGTLRFSRENWTQLMNEYGLKEAKNSNICIVQHKPSDTGGSYYNEAI